MKLKTLEEVTGKLYWIQRQYLKTKPRWEVLPVGEPVLGYLMKEDFLVGAFQKAWPEIPAHEIGVGSVLQEWGYELEYRGDCASEFGNGYIVRKINPVTQEIEHPQLIVGALRGRQKEAVGLEKKLFFRDKYIWIQKKIILEKLLLTRKLMKFPLELRKLNKNGSAASKRALKRNFFGFLEILA